MRTRTAKILPLSRESHVAMHRQLAQQLRQAIAGGVYKAGERIPPESELTARYAVSRITARQAVSHLAREGLVVRKQGKGTFVAGLVVRHDLLDMRGIYDEMVMQGLAPDTTLLDFDRVVPPPRVAERLRTGNATLVAWRRLYRLDGKPFGVSRVYVNPGPPAVTRQQASRYPTYALLESVLGLTIERAEIAIRYESATRDLQKTLGVPASTPMMALERVSYSEDGVPREHTIYHARAETYEFSINVRGKIPIAAALTAVARRRR